MNMNQLLLIAFKALTRYVAAMAAIALCLWAIAAVNHWLLTVCWILAILLLSTFPAVSAGMKAFRASARATTVHQEYLMGNGATRQEALLPSRQRGLRATQVYGLRGITPARMLQTLLLLTTLLLTGVSPVKGVIIVFLLTVGALLSSVALVLTGMNHATKHKDW